MKYFSKSIEGLNIKAQISIFGTEYEFKESHVFLSFDENADTNKDFLSQYTLINTCLNGVIKEYLGNDMVICFKRLFLSDALNQVEIVKQNQVKDYPLSIVQQPPLPDSKIAVWAYLVSSEKSKKEKENLFCFEHNGYSHLWLADLHNDETGVYKQTLKNFKDIEKACESVQCTVNDNCIRTWLFVNDVDCHYKDVVEARNDYFDTIGLTSATHFIASTGIEGKNGSNDSGVMIDAYIVKGLEQGQVTFLYGRPNMNPTYEYGVAFERATAVDYGDRRHIFISGTASIDNEGNIVAKGNIRNQLERAFENVEVLLKEGGAGISDLAHLIVYLRDLADYNNVKHFFENISENFPYLILLAPVCRPGWLVELEGIAIVKQEKTEFRDF